MVASSTELKPGILNALRKATSLIIKFDKRTITLIPQTQSKSDGGRVVWTDGTPRDPQTFNIAPVGSTLQGITSTTGGVVGSQTGGATSHEWSYLLTGLFDAEIEVNDYWIDGESKYRVVAIQPFNGYEKTAIVTSFGKDPNYGS